MRLNAINFRLQPKNQNIRISLWNQWIEYNSSSTSFEKCHQKLRPVLLSRENFFFFFLKSLPNLKKTGRNARGSL
jgi:hypothetical protein